MIDASNLPNSFDRSIDKLIYDIVEHKKSDDYMILYEKLLNSELFFSIITDAEKSDGTQLRVKNRDQIRVPMTSSFNGLNMLVFHTSSQDVRLSKPYAGIRGDKGFEIVSKMPEADGLIIQNNESSWIGLRKEQIKRLLAK
jgi:hypothetical protein